MEILIVTLWFYALVAIATALAAALIVKAVRADNRDLAKFEPPVSPNVETAHNESQPLAA